MTPRSGDGETGKRKRGNGEGSISLRKDGRFEISVVDPATGKRRRAYAKSEAEAKRVLRRMNTRADAGVPVVDAGATVAAYSAAWINDRAGRRRRESTVREYEYRLTRYVLPALGRMRLREVTVVDVEDLFGVVAERLGRDLGEMVKAEEGGDKEDYCEEEKPILDTDFTDCTDFFKKEKSVFIRAIRVRFFVLTPEGTKEKENARQPEGEIENSELIVPEKIKRRGEKGK